MIDAGYDAGAAVIPFVPAGVSKVVKGGTKVAKGLGEVSSTRKGLKKTIVPILNGDVSLPDVGADWIFIDLALCKIVNPSNFHKLKQIILSHVRKMYMCKEPNILDYYDNLEDILQYLEYTQL